MHRRNTTEEKTHFEGTGTPQASRSNPTTGGFSVQTNRASCVSVRQNLFCLTETTPFREGRKHLLPSRNFGRKEVQIPKSDGWSIYGSIAGFEYEKDYECKIKVSETSYLNYSMDDPAWIERDLLEVSSKDKKDSEDLPLHLIPKTYYKNIPLPQYRYAVEANNKVLIEANLEAHPILPEDYHYMLCNGESGLRWIGILDENNVLGPHIVKTTSKKPEEMPESYKILPSDETIASCGEWTFLDESDNTTNYSPFDVFIMKPTKEHLILYIST